MVICANPATPVSHHDFGRCGGHHEMVDSIGLAYCA